MKLILNDVGQVQSSGPTLNSNFDEITEALENTLSRDGTSPNEMNADLDMNDNRIYNLPDPLTATEPLRLGDASSYNIGDLTELTDQAAEDAETASKAADLAMAAAGGSLFFETETEAALLPSGFDWFETVGQDDADDEGGGRWQVDNSDPGNAKKISLSGGRYGRFVEKVLRPEQFGIKFDGTLNQEQGFYDLTKELRYRGGGRVVFPENKTVHVLDVFPGASSGTKLFNLGTDLGKVTLDFEGCKIVCNYNFASPYGFDIVWAESIRGLEVNNLEIDHPNMPDTVPVFNSIGTVGCWVQGNSRDIEASIKMRSGKAPLWIVGDATGGPAFPDGVSRTKGIRAFLEMNYGTYGYASSASGDDAEIHVKTKSVERNSIVYNVNDLELHADVRPAAYNTNWANQVLLSANGYTGYSKEFRSLSHVRAFITAHDDDPTVAASHSGHFGGNVLFLQALEDNAAELNDIKINLVGENNGSWGYPILTTRGGAGVHKVNGVKLSGRWTQNAAKAANDVAFAIFDSYHTGGFPNGGDAWASDEVYNVHVEDFVIDGTSTGTADMRIGAAGMKGGLVVKNVKSHSDIVFNQGVPAGVLDASFGVDAANLKSDIRGVSKASATVNFNSANTDTPITIPLPPSVTRYRIDKIIISGASASLSTATFGVFTATGGGGTAVVAAATAITVSTASENTANNYQEVSPASATMSNNSATLYFRVGTAQGSAATGTVTVLYRPIS